MKEQRNRHLFETSPIGDRDMAAPPGIAGVAGHALAAMEDFHSRLSDPKIDQLADQAKGDRVPAPVRLYMIVWRDTGPSPAGEDIRLGR